MSEFEFLAVFVSIVFGIAVTHVLAGVMRSFYRGQRDTTHLVLTAFIFLVLVLNWWTTYTWRDQEVWSFELFLIIIIWAMSHYVAAITLYPPLASGDEHPFEYRRHWFYIAFLGICVTDTMQTVAAGNVFEPWYYLPFVLHYAALAVIALVARKPVVYYWTAWYLLVSIAAWSFIVRRFLG
jgi:hypothetical protein